MVYVRRTDLYAGRSDQTAAKLWLKLDFSRDLTVKWNHTISLFVVNCPAQTYQAIQTTIYYANGDNYPADPDTGPTFVTPGTIMAASVNLLCMDPPVDPVTNR